MLLSQGNIEQCTQCTTSAFQCSVVSTVQCVYEPLWPAWWNERARQWRTCALCTVYYVLTEMKLKMLYSCAQHFSVQPTACTIVNCSELYLVKLVQATELYMHIVQDAKSTSKCNKYKVKLYKLPFFFMQTSYNAYKPQQRIKDLLSNTECDKIFNAEHRKTANFSILN